MMQNTHINHKKVLLYCIVRQRFLSFQPLLYCKNTHPLRRKGIKNRASAQNIYNCFQTKYLIIGKLYAIFILTLYANNNSLFMKNVSTRKLLSIFFNNRKAISKLHFLVRKTHCISLLFNDILRTFPAIGRLIKRSSALRYVKNSIRSNAMAFQNRRYSPLHMDALGMEIARKAIVLI